MLIAFCLSRRNCSADVIPVFMTTAPTWAGEFPATLAFKRAWANGAKAKPSVTGMELRERPKLFTSRQVIEFLVVFCQFANGAHAFVTVSSTGGSPRAAVTPVANRMNGPLG